MRYGIRFRVAAPSAVAVVALLIAMAVVLLAAQRRMLTEHLDETLSVAAAELFTVSTRPDLPSVVALPRRGDEDAVAQITTGDGRVIAATPNDGDVVLPTLAEDTLRQVRTVRLKPGEPMFRVLSQRDGARIVHVASPLDDVDESVAALGRALSVAIPVAVIALGGLIWWLVGRTLRPVDAIRQEVESISVHSLHRRVPESSARDEIERLARTMNVMLDRVERSVRAQRQFAADASHELRSPLTRMRAELKVDLAHPGGADLRATHRSALAEIEQMQRLVEDLLTLARHDAGATTLRSVRVDLDDVVASELRRARSSAVRFESTGVCAAQVDGDAAQLGRVVRNLLDNAAQHARTAVTVVLTEGDGVARLSVSDDGPGIAPEDRERIFDRFTRVDAARSFDDGGSGLGLAIARSIIERHGGTLQLDPSVFPGARFVVKIPTHP